MIKGAGFILHAMGYISTDLETRNRIKGVNMKSNRQARHLLGLNYKLSNQKKVLVEGGSESLVSHATGRKRRG